MASRRRAAAGADRKDERLRSRPALTTDDRCRAARRSAAAVSEARASSRPAEIASIGRWWSARGRCSTCPISSCSRRACRLRQARIATCVSPGTTGTAVASRLPRRSGRGWPPRTRRHAPSLVPVQLEKRPSEPQRTRYHLTLPGARLPIVALRLDVGGTYVFRRAAVTEARLTAWQAEPVTIGRSALVREGTAGALRLPIQQPSQREIDLLDRGRGQRAARRPIDHRGARRAAVDLLRGGWTGDGAVRRHQPCRAGVRPRGRACVDRHRARAGSALGLGRPRRLRRPRRLP